MTKLAHFFHLSPGYFAIIMAHLIWGVNFLAAKVALQEIPPFSLAFSRFFISILLLLPFLFIERKKINFEVKDLPWFILAGSLMTTFNIALFYEGLARSTPIDASVLSMIVPIVSVLLGWSILKEKIYTVNLIGIFLGLLGALGILGVHQIFLGGSFTSTRILGNVLLIIGYVCFVVGAVISKLYLKKYSALFNTFMIFLVATLAFLIPAIKEYLKDPSFVNQISILGLFSLGFIIIGSSIAAFFLFEWGLMKLGVVKADLFQYIEPLVATTLAVLILNDQLHYSLIIGGILIGLGVYWGTLGKETHKRSKAHRH